MTRSRPQTQDRQSGFALVAVLWFMVLVSAVVASFAVAARTDLLISSNAHQRLRLDLTAENIASSLSQRLVQEGSVALPLDSIPVACEVAGYSVQIRVQDQAGLIDLNAADKHLLSLGLRSLGLAQDQSEAVAAKIVQFRSYFSETDVAVVGGMKGAPFESVAELSDIEPLGKFELSELQRVFTAISRQPFVLLSRSPSRLATELGVAGGQLVRHQASETVAAALSLEVTVRQGARRIRGYAGYLIVQPDQPGRPARRIEPLFEAALGDDFQDRTVSCPSSLLAELMLLGLAT